MSKEELSEVKSAVSECNNLFWRFGIKLSCSETEFRLGGYAIEIVSSGIFPTTFFDMMRETLNKFDSRFFVGVVKSNAVVYIK